MLGARISSLTIQSFGYGGGTDFTGSTITIPPATPTGPLGGFATVLSLFDSTGNFIADSFFSTCGANANTSPNTGLCFDAGLSATVGAGTFYLALTQYDNFSNGNNLFASPNVVDPSIFAENGNGNFTSLSTGGILYGAVLRSFRQPDEWQLCH